MRHRIWFVYFLVMVALLGSMYFGREGFSRETASVFAIAVAAGFVALVVFYRRNCKLLDAVTTQPSRENVDILWRLVGLKRKDRDR